jgi:nucleoside-diphosphate-sugar epimerase
MSKRCFVTGATGALGSAILQASATFDTDVLVRQIQPGSYRQVKGCLPKLPSCVNRDYQLIVHAAADTRFNAPREELWNTNVEGTAEIIRLARACPELERILYLSTTCVWGNTSGTMEPEPCHSRPKFHNSYEASKWEAEKLLLESGLPIQIIRIPIVLGSETDGTITRNGAIHAALRWVARGLLPVIPYAPGARLDLISTEHLTQALCKLLFTHEINNSIIHLTNGTNAPLVTDLLDFLFNWLEVQFPNDRDRPELVDFETYRLFKELIDDTRDALFRTIYQNAEALLSTLLYPKTYRPTANLELTPIAWPVLCQKVFKSQLTPFLTYSSNPCPR